MQGKISILTKFVLCRADVVHTLHRNYFLTRHMSIYLSLQNVVEVRDCTITLQNPSDSTAPSKVFTYDSAYDGSAQTETIYNEICYPLVEVR